MQHFYWGDWYLGSGRFLWLGFLVLLFSSVGNGRYTHRAHQKFKGTSPSDAFNILDARHARGDIVHDEYALMKSEIGVRTPSASRARDV